MKKTRPLIRVYYAHPMSWYDTAREAADLLALAEYFGKDNIVNPARCEEKDMGFYLSLVRDCDGIVYRPFLDGRLGAGVAKEVMEAVLHEKLIWRFVSPRTSAFMQTFDPFTPSPLSRLETRKRVKEGVL